MKDETIISVIKGINSKTQPVLSMISIASNVQLYAIAKNVLRPKNSTISDDGVYYFYLIKNESSKYVAAVLDMYQDLHWVVLPRCRKRGYLICPLREIILPHLMLKHNQNEIRITIDKGLEENFFNASTGVAISVGFIKEKEDLEKVGYILLAKPVGQSMPKYNHR